MTEITFEEIKEKYYKGEHIRVYTVLEKVKEMWDLHNGSGVVYHNGHRSKVDSKTIDSFVLELNLSDHYYFLNDEEFVMLVL